eukprot:COSAG05_NODE_12836_length_452_cov_1.019830_1_plen_40_part_10
MALNSACTSCWEDLPCTSPVAYCPTLDQSGRGVMYSMTSE